MGETRRATIQEAARIMGVSEGAIRKRVKRNTLRHDKDTDGRVYVYLDAGVDTRVDEVSHPDNTTLISEMRERVEDLHNEVRHLREVLGREQDARQRADMMIAQLTQANAALAARIPELEAPVPRPAPSESSEEPSDAPETPADEQQGRGPVPDSGGPQEGAEQPWWRRVFGA